MFTINVQYDNTGYDSEKLAQAKQYILLNGITKDELYDSEDDIMLPAAIEAAQELGWNLDECIREKKVIEHLETCFLLGEVDPFSGYGHIMVSALEYIKNHR